MKRKFAKVMFLFASLLSLCGCNSNKTCQITYEENQYLTFTGPAYVTYGGSLTATFTYASTTKYDYSEMKLYANDQEISFTGTSFTIPTVTSNLLIKEVGATLHRYSVAFSDTEAIAFHGESKAEKNSNYTFTVTRLNEEDYDYSEMKILVNGKEIKPVDDVYTVNKVTADLYIRATGILSNYVSVTFVQTSLFKFTGNASAKKGEDYTFTLQVLDKLVDQSTMEVTVNNVTVTPTDGVYHVTVQKEDLYIKVSKYEYSDPTADDEENQGDNPVDDLE